ncbi:aluminum activated malate transporter-domain-containing protein [Blakeslea trispora]|nr:aluminum activated malate transporter-domain-containing protein [Blakeslea trispora]
MMVIDEISVNDDMIEIDEEGGNIPILFLLLLKSAYFPKARELWKKILKCVIAYEIATILILIPDVYKIAGNPPYLVPLGTIFFHASGTAGNQIIMMALNVVMMVLPAIFTGIISYLCVLYNRALVMHPSLYSNGAGIIAAISFCTCVFVIAYYRLKYPRIFLPALQGFTLPFFVLTRDIYSTEYNVLNVVNTVYPVLIGGAIALLCNLVLWPETAAKAAEQSLGNSIQSIKTVLSFVHKDLLKNDDSNLITGDIPASTKLQNLNNKLQKDIASMREARKDAKYEIVISYYAPKYYKPLSQSLSALSHHLLGFSLAIKREVRIMAEKKVEAHLRNNSNNRSPAENNPDVACSTTLSSSQSSGFTSATNVNQSSLSIPGTWHGDTLLQGREYKSIGRLQSIIQPSLKIFLSACIEVLDQIEHELIDNKAITVSNRPVQTRSNHSRATTDLSKALQDFKKTEILIKQEYDVQDTAPSEDHCLIFTIIYTLVEFGKELIILQNCANRLVSQSNQGKGLIHRVHLSRVSWTQWLSRETNQIDSQDLCHQLSISNKEVDLNHSQQNRDTSNESSISINQSITDSHDDAGTQKWSKAPEESQVMLKRKASQIASRIENVSSLTGTGFEEEKDQMDFYDQLDFYQENETTPLQQAAGKQFWKKSLYRLNKWLQYGPTRYAFKFTIAAMLLSLMAFLPIPGVNKLYNDNHGQWALLSAMVVINYTVGSTAWQCLYRVIATVVGGVAGYICLLAANRNQNPYVLAIMILIFQIPMWYLLLGSKYPRIGFISVLTLAVICSSSYTNMLNESIFEPIWKRTVTAILAIIVVMIVDQLVWPVWARKELRKRLSDLLIATGIQYFRVASLVCQEDIESHRYRTTLNECEVNQKALLREMHLVQEMLRLSSDEPRLTKGPFPLKEYGSILEHERNILYWTQHNQRAQSFITKEVRQAIMIPMNSYRKEMATSVHLYLFTLACSLRTKSSLPASLPSAEVARRMLQQKQTLGWKRNYKQLRKQSYVSLLEQKSAEDQMYWHTYAAGSTEVVVEQEAMGEAVMSIMGQHVFKAATRDWID